MFALWLRARKSQSKLPRESRVTRFLQKLPPAAVVARFFSGITPMIWSKLFSLIFFAAQAQLACRHCVRFPLIKSAKRSSWLFVLCSRFGGNRSTITSQRNRIQFREDQTNKDFGPLRNRVRHRVIPYLERVFGRNIRQSIWRAAMIAAEENDWINSLIDEQATSATELSVQKLRVQPIAAQRRVLQKWLRRHGVADVGYDLIERVRELLAPAQSVAKTNLPGARHVRRRAKKIFIDG